MNDTDWLARDGRVDSHQTSARGWGGAVSKYCKQFSQLYLLKYESCSIVLASDAASEYCTQFLHVQILSSSSLGRTGPLHCGQLSAEQLDPNSVGSRHRSHSQRNFLSLDRARFNFISYSTTARIGCNFRCSVLCSCT